MRKGVDISGLAGKNSVRVSVEDGRTEGPTGRSGLRDWKLGCWCHPIGDEANASTAEITTKDLSVTKCLFLCCMFRKNEYFHRIFPVCVKGYFLTA